MNNVINNLFDVTAIQTEIAKVAQLLKDLDERAAQIGVSLRDNLTFTKLAKSAEDLTTATRNYNNEAVKTRQVFDEGSRQRQQLITLESKLSAAETETAQAIQKKIIEIRMATAETKAAAQADIIAEKENKGLVLSYKEMQLAVSAAENALKNMTTAEIQGSKGAELATKVAKYRDELKAADVVMNVYNRNVGNYSSAVGENANKTETLRTQMRKVREELVLLTEGTAEYDAKARELGALMDKQADANSVAKMYASDTQGLDILKQTTGAVSGSMQGLITTFALAGEEGGQFAQVAKIIAVAQIGANIATTLANNLQKESVIRRKAQVLIDKAFGTQKKAETIAITAATAATAAETGATEVATVATSIWGKVMNALPIFLIIAGLAALVTGIMAAVSWLDSGASSAKRAEKAMQDFEVAVGQADETLKDIQNNTAIAELAEDTRYAAEMSELLAKNASKAQIAQAELTHAQNLAAITAKGLNEEIIVTADNLSNSWQNTRAQLDALVNDSDSEFDAIRNAKNMNDAYAASLLINNDNISESEQEKVQNFISSYRKTMEYERLYQLQLEQRTNNEVRANADSATSQREFTETAINEARTRSRTIKDLQLSLMLDEQTREEATLKEAARRRIEDFKGTAIERAEFERLTNIQLERDLEAIWFKYTGQIDEMTQSREQEEKNRVDRAIARYQNEADEQTRAAQRANNVLKEEYLKGAITKEEYDLRSEELAQKLTKETLDITIAGLKKLLENVDATAEQREQWARELADLEVETETAATDAKILQHNRELESLKQIRAAQTETINAGLDLFSEVSTAMAEIDQERINKMREADDAAFAAQQEQINNGLMSAEMKAAEEKRLAEDKERRDKAIADKEKSARNKANAIELAVSIAKQIIATQVAVTEALAIPPPAGEIIAAQRRIQGYIALATILATSIPKFEHGGITPAGYALWGEKRPEVAVTKKGDVMLATKPTITNFDAGTIIFPSIKNYEQAYERAMADRAGGDMSGVIEVLTKIERKSFGNSANFQIMTNDLVIGRKGSINRKIV